MPQNAIGLGVRTPIERIQTVTQIFAVLIKELQKANVPVVLLGAPENGEADAPLVRLLLDPESPGTYVQVDKTEYSVAAIRDYTGALPSQGVPTLNETEVRAATADKFVLSDILGEDGLPTTLLEAGENLSTQIRDFDNGPYIVKPVHGVMAKGVEIIRTLEQADKSYAKKMIIQPYVDTTQMPKQLVGIGDFYAGLVATEGVPKEIRMFSYRFADGETDMLPLLRVSKTVGILLDDHYVIIEPESVPDEAYALARRAFDKIAAYTGIPHMHGAIDIIWLDGAFRVMEINTREPALPKMKKDKEGEDAEGKIARVSLGLLTRQLVARQLVGLAVDKQPTVIDKTLPNVLKYT